MLKNKITSNNIMDITKLVEALKTGKRNLKDSSIKTYMRQWKILGA